MSETVIQVEKLGKKYIITHKENTRNKYIALRDVLAESARAGFRKILNPFREGAREKSLYEEFWALKDISFEVNQGDRIGVIGRNGAGKSTLLKLISRITEPTEGKISIKGRVASLLEVGTGFHPELTGRENIYLNGAILGMSKVEIKKKFDEIVDFAEIEKFLDTPVKKFSSGMYVKLAFSVAAHLEPEILLVDEVLAVGDAHFQKKCLGKMEEVGKIGRTILLVSHNMITIKALANKAIYLGNGKTEGITDVQNAVYKYTYGTECNNLAYFKTKNTLKNSEAFILEARIYDNHNILKEKFTTYDDINVELKWINKNGIPVTPNIMLVNQNGITVLIAFDTPIDFTGEKKKEKGIYINRFKIPGNFLNANDYTMHIALDGHSPRICFEVHYDALRFSVWDPMDDNCIARGMFTHVRGDAVLWPALQCSFEKISNEISI